MAIVVKGIIRRQCWGGKQPVTVINGHKTPLWPPTHLQNVKARATEWLQYGYAADDDPRVDDYMRMLEESWRAAHCRANFRSIQIPNIKPHAHEPWFTIWGSLRSQFFTQGNLVEILYSPEWRVGIIRRAIRIPSNCKPGRYFSRHIQSSVIL